MLHIAYCSDFEQDFLKNAVIFGQKVCLNDQNMLHGIPIQSDVTGVVCAGILKAERPLTVSGPFNGKLSNLVYSIRSVKCALKCNCTSFAIEFG